MNRRTANRKPELVRAAKEARPIPIGSFAIPEFCESEGISPSMYYKMSQEGWGPATFKVGARTLISTESAAAWRKARTEAHAAANKAAAIEKATAAAE